MAEQSVTGLTSAPTLDPVQEVLDRHDMTLDELRFVSLAGTDLVVLRPPVIRTIRSRDGNYDERRHRDPFRFEDGVYPARGRKLTYEEAAELVTHLAFAENPHRDKSLFRVMPKPAPPPKSQEEIIEERAQQIADERVRAILAEQGIALEGQDEGLEDEDEDVVANGADPTLDVTTIRGVSSKQEAVEALQKAGADVSSISSLSNVTVGDIVQEARRQGFVFDSWGD